MLDRVMKIMIFDKVGERPSTIRVAKLTTASSHDGASRPAKVTFIAAPEVVEDAHRLTNETIGVAVSALHDATGDGPHA